MDHSKIDLLSQTILTLFQTYEANSDEINAIIARIQASMFYEICAMALEGELKDEQEDENSGEKVH